MESLNYCTITSLYPKDYTWNSKEACIAAAAILNLASELTSQEEPLWILKDRVHDDYSNTIDKAKLFALNNMVKQPWFTQIWITQEIRVAKEALLVYSSTTMN